MAVSEACALWVEQRIEEELGEQQTTGKSLRSIGRDIAKEIEKYFETKVAPETLTSRVFRMKHKSVSNETPDATTENDTENTQKVKEEKEENMAEPILCKECNKRIAKRRKEKGSWQYTKHGLCDGCWNEANGRPRVKHKPKKQSGEKLERAVKEEREKQEKYWRIATEKLKGLAEYMLENCKIPNGFSADIKEAFSRYFDTLEVFKNELR